MPSGQTQFDDVFGLKLHRRTLLRVAHFDHLQGPHPITDVGPIRSAEDATGHGTDDGGTDHCTDDCADQQDDSTVAVQQESHVTRSDANDPSSKAPVCPSYTFTGAGGTAPSSGNAAQHEPHERD